VCLEISAGSVAMASTKLFVYGVNARCPRDVLESEFGACGVVEDVYNTGKGYAFVTMADQEGADKAIAELNGVTVDGQEIKVDAAKAPREGGDRPRRNDRDGEGGGYRGGRGGGFRGGRGGGYRGGRGGGRGGYGGGRGGGGYRGGRGGGGRGGYQDSHDDRANNEGDRRQED